MAEENLSVVIAGYPDLLGWIVGGMCFVWRVLLTEITSMAELASRLRGVRCCVSPLSALAPEDAARRMQNTFVESLEELAGEIEAVTADTGVAQESNC